jgi:hypothetical protein
VQARPARCSDSPFSSRWHFSLGLGDPRTPIYRPAASRRSTGYTRLN